MNDRLDTSHKTPPAAVPANFVSVIVPCHNAAAFLPDTISSVLGQTHRALELIVVDDASSDNSAAVVERFAVADARARLVRMPRNAGAPAAPRNAGVRAARGDWIAFLDADDLWHPRKLELQMRALVRTGAQMCSTRMVDFRDASLIVYAGVPDDPPLERITFVQQLMKYRTPTSSIVVRRARILENPFNEDPSYKAREDTDCFIRMHELIGDSIKICVPLVYYRQQANQISGNKWKMIPRHLAMLRNYRLRSGRGLGVMAYVYTATHFIASIWLRLVRGIL